MNARANAVGPRTRMVVLNSPHNPTGHVTTQEMLDALSDAMEGTDAAGQRRGVRPHGP